MRALRSFTVRVRLPDPLAPLQELATNLRWSWDGRTRDLFRWVDPSTWEEVGHDPVRLLGRVHPERLDALAADPAFLSFLRDVHSDLRRYLEAPLWFQNRPGSELSAVAYFSPEFGIAEALPQYSGGLGVLAGDHLKAASTLGLPLVGMGLLYREGYFRQELSPDGWQQERYPLLDPFAMAVRPVEGARVAVDLAGAPLVAQVWRADVGRVRLYLLDSDVEDNEPEDRLVTDRLYGGDIEHRLRQEILLGVGGVRALAVLHEPTQVFHTNEGHAGFLGLERIRSHVADGGLRFDEALEAVRASTVFTTHTPVPAGIDQFPRALMERHFASWCDECGIGLDTLMALGHFPGEDPGGPFNMAVMGLRLAGAANGVSALHGTVSRSMFAPLWPGIEVEEVPITSVTNGVHAATWVSPEMDDLVTRAVLPTWSEAEPDDWARFDTIPDDQLWRARELGRDRLVALVRARLRASLAAAGLSGPELTWCDEALDPRVLTIGFARRFASYKRATLLLSEPDRLTALLTSADRPVQIVFAGKAHPADDLGKDMIRQIVQFSRDAAVRHRMAFVEDYDIAVARALYQGCDLWLNTPRRPMEACGTSGMKSALNGGLNCSILDGWWDEWFDGDNGWAVASAEAYDDTDRRDAVEGASLFDLLERQIVPLFYDRIGGPVPRGWARRVKASVRSLGPQVVASRMVREYTERMYEPLARRTAALSAAGHRRSRELAAWKARVRDAWPEVGVEWIDADGSSVDLGAKRRVEAVVALGALDPADVAVQLLHGPVGATDELTVVNAVDMEPVADGDSGRGGREPRRRYTGTFSCAESGRYGFTVRVLPAHDDLASPVELGLAAWA
ncbi:MAG: alpha-glucan family phosphorylase [Acidimicrobiales bacterium]